MEQRSQIQRITLQPGRPSQSSAFASLGEGVMVQTPGMQASERDYLDGGEGFLVFEGLALVAWGDGPAMMVGVRELNVWAEIDGLDVTLTLYTYDPRTKASDDPASFDQVVLGWDYLNEPTAPEPFNTTFSHTYSAPGTYRIYVETQYLPIVDTTCTPDHPMRTIDVTVS